MIDPLNPDYTNTPVSDKRPIFDYAPTDKNNKPYVSIITPYYNTGEIFHETAQSILRQSFQQWEWLIVNDASTNSEALAVLDEYRNCDPRIRVIDQAVNQGSSAARNRGFEEADTKYVMQLDSDDLIEPTTLEKLFWFLESYPEYGMASGYTVGFNASEYLWEKGFHNGSAFLEENMVDVNTMVRKEVHQLIGGYDESIRPGVEDWDYWLRCANKQKWGGTVNEYFDWYRIRQSHRSHWDNWGDKLKVFHDGLKQKYWRLWEGGFPEINPPVKIPFDKLNDIIPCENKLTKFKKRVLILVPWLIIGGAEKFNLDVIKQLTKRGYEVSLVATLNGRDEWMPEFCQYTPDVFVLEHFLQPIDYPRFLRYIIGSRQPDIIFTTNSELGYYLLPYLRAAFPNIPLVDLSHAEEEHWKNGGYPRMTINYQHYLDLTMVTSEYLKNWIVKHGGDEQRIKVCYTNIDPEIWKRNPLQRAEIRQKLSINDHTPLILHASRLTDQKQPRVMAGALLGLHKRGANFKALIAGHGPDFKWLENFIQEHELQQKIELLGAVSNQQVKNLLHAADIFFLPSWYEGISLAIYEAMAMEVLVVASAVGGHRELVTPECGVLLTRSTQEQEAEEYSEILFNLVHDPHLCQELSRAARERICQLFDIELMGDRLEELFEQAKQWHKDKSRPIVDPEQALEVTADILNYFAEIRYSKGSISTISQKQQQWIDQLVEGKNWLEGQWQTWMQLAERREEIIQEYTGYIRQLEEAKGWLEEQCRTFEHLAQHRESIIQEHLEIIQQLREANSLLEQQLKEAKSNTLPQWETARLTVGNFKNQLDKIRGRRNN